MNSIHDSWKNMQIISFNHYHFSVFDSSGKMPDGMYADTYEFCERLEKFYAAEFGFTCDSAPPNVTLPFSLNLFRGLINVPFGNTKAFGSFQGCINVKQEFEMNDTVHNIFNISQLNGQYVRLSVDPNFEALMPQRVETRLAGIIAGGGLLGPIIDQVFNSSEILSSVRYTFKIGLFDYSCMYFNFRLNFCINLLFNLHS